VIDHIGLTVSDLPRAQAVSAARAPLGYRLLAEFPAEVSGSGAVGGFGVAPKPDLWLAAGTPNRAPVPVALRMPARELLQTSHPAAPALPRALLRRVPARSRRSQPRSGVP